MAGKLQRIEAGVLAWQTGKEYHRSKRQKRRVYHFLRVCPAGLKIELRHLRGGQGVNRQPCRVCASIRTT